MIDQNQILCAYLSASGVEEWKYKNKRDTLRDRSPDNIMGYKKRKINKVVINEIEDEIGIDLEFLKHKLTKRSG